MSWGSRGRSALDKPFSKHRPIFKAWGWLVKNLSYQPPPQPKRCLALSNANTGTIIKSNRLSGSGSSFVGATLAASMPGYFLFMTDIKLVRSTSFNHVIGWYLWRLFRVRQSISSSNLRQIVELCFSIITRLIARRVFLYSARMSALSFTL